MKAGGMDEDFTPCEGQLALPLVPLAVAPSTRLGHVTWVEVVEYADRRHYQATCTCGARGWLLDTRVSGSFGQATEEGRRHENV